jgi:hypothetical protein
VAAGAAAPAVAVKESSAATTATALNVDVLMRCIDLSPAAVANQPNPRARAT